MKRDNLRLKGEKLEDLRMIESTREENSKYKVVKITYNTKNWLDICNRLI